MPSFIYLFLSAVFGALCGWGTAYLSSSSKHRVPKQRQWMVYFTVVAGALVCASGIGYLNRAGHPSETIKYLSSAFIALAFIATLLRTRRGT